MSCSTSHDLVENEEPGLFSQTGDDIASLLSEMVDNNLVDWNELEGSLIVL